MLYRNRTSPQSLSEGEANYTVDLSDATLLEDPSFFDNARESIQEWLQSDHLGLYGWLWVALAAAAVFLSCCACSLCTNWSKKRKAQKAVRRELGRQLGAARGEGHQQYQYPVAAMGAPPRSASRASSQRMPLGWEASPRNPNPSGVARAPSSHSEVPRAPSYHGEVARAPSYNGEVARAPSYHGEVTRAPNRHAPSSISGRAPAAGYDPLASPAF